MCLGFLALLLAGVGALRKSKRKVAVTATSTRADLQIHGIMVRNYHLAFRAGKAESVERDYNIAGDALVDWIFLFKDDVTTEYIDTWCVHLSEQGRAQCTTHGHPSEGGISEAVVRASLDSLRELLSSQTATDRLEA